MGPFLSAPAFTPLCVGFGVCPPFSQVFGSDARVSLWMKLVGLFHCKETMVGDHMVRGISGGEKKRLTTAEMLVGSGEEGARE